LVDLAGAAGADVGVQKAEGVAHLVERHGLASEPAVVVEVERRARAGRGVGGRVVPVGNARVARLVEADHLDLGRQLADGHVSERTDPLEHRILDVRFVSRRLRRIVAVWIFTDNRDSFRDLDGVKPGTFLPVAIVIGFNPELHGIEGYASMPRMIVAAVALTTAGLAMVACKTSSPKEAGGSLTKDVATKRCSVFVDSTMEAAFGVANDPFKQIVLNGKGPCDRRGPGNNRFTGVEKMLLDAGCAVGRIHVSETAFFTANPLGRAAQTTLRRSSPTVS
jgi:hypothetical protein